MEMKKAKALVVDGCGTSWEGRVGSGIGEAILKREFLHGHLRNVIEGVRGRTEVKRIVKEKGVNGEAEGLKKFYEILVRLGLGERYEMSRYAHDYIGEHINLGVWSIVNIFDSNAPRILSTIGGSTAANAALHYFNFTHVLSNIDVFANPDIFTLGRKLKGVELRIMNGEQKLAVTSALLDGFGIKIGDCAVIGDGISAVPLLRSAGLPIGVHNSIDEVKGIKGITMMPEKRV